jgi:gluconokinase
MGSIVVMGVAGCGKSSLGHALAAAQGLQVVEGDDFHDEASRQKMGRGIPLTDADREAWLDKLACQLQLRPQGVVLTCSALKRAYRDRLRAAGGGLCFVFMDIARDQAHVRVTSRAPTHFFSPSLVDSQFATLERPDGEAGVLRVDALEPLPQLTTQVIAWLQSEVKS